MQRIRRRGLFLGATLVAVCTVAACSHAPTGNGSAAVRSLNGDAAGGLTEPATPNAKLEARAPGSSYGAAVDAGAARIRTATITVAITGAANVAGKADQADGIATTAGGEIDSDDRVSGSHASATLQLRVPPAALLGTLRALSHLGKERSRSLSTTDVTEKVADVTSRVASARQSINRLRSLYAHAVKVADVIAIESELGSREADLESLQAQQRTLARQTSMAQVTVSLVTAAKAVAPPSAKKKTGGFLGGLERGWHGFASAAAWVAAALGTVMPFLLLALVLAVAARFARGRWGRPRSTPDPAPAE